MAVLYLDMSKGISGDMFVSASYAFMACQKREPFLRKLKEMGDSIGLRVKVEEVCSCEYSGWRINWEARGSEKPRSASEAMEIVSQSCSLLRVSERSRMFADKVIGDIIRAEAEAHGTNPQDVHLHEIGRLSGLANIASAALCMDFLGIGDKELIGSYISIGRGYVDTSHGRLSIPTPASASLLKGMRFRFGPSEGEMATPTGIAIARNAICRQVDVLPEAARAGVGFGSRKFGNGFGYVRIFCTDAEGV